MNSPQQNLAKVMERDILSLRPRDETGTLKAIEKVLMQHRGEIPWNEQECVDVEIGIREASCGCTRHYTYPIHPFNSVPCLKPHKPFRVQQDGRVVHLGCEQEIGRVDLGRVMLIVGGPPTLPEGGTYKSLYG